MFILGLILFLLGLFLGVPILFWLGIVLMIAGAFLWFGPVGGPRDTRRRYY